MEASSPPIAERLRSLRGDKDLSLDELAKRSGVSRAMLSKIERGAASPTIGLLCKISGALGISLTQLVAEPPKNTSRVVRREEVIPFADPSGITRTSLSTDVAGWGIELLRYEYPPRTSTGEACGCADGREIIHIVEGELELRCGGSTHRLKTGDTVLLDWSEPNEIRNPTGQRAIAYMVIDRRPKNLV